MNKQKRAPYTKRALQTTINNRDEQIRLMKKAGSIRMKRQSVKREEFRKEIDDLKTKVKNLETELEGFKK